MDIMKKMSLLADLLEVDVSEIQSETMLDTIPNWDSMAALSLIVLLEEHFGKTDIDGRQISQMQKIEDVLKIMEK